MYEKSSITVLGTLWNTTESKVIKLGSFGVTELSGPKIVENVDTQNVPSEMEVKRKTGSVPVKKSSDPASALLDQLKMVISENGGKFKLKSPQKFISDVRVYETFDDS